MFEEEEMWILWQLNYHKEATEKVTEIPQEDHSDLTSEDVQPLEVQ